MFTVRMDTDVVGTKTGEVRFGNNDLDENPYNFRIAGVVESPRVSVAVSPATVIEDGATNLVYTFSRNGGTTSPLTVNFQLGGTATDDYTVAGAASFNTATGAGTARTSRR